jgi:hypothetical protein
VSHDLALTAASTSALGRATFLATLIVTVTLVALLMAAEGLAQGGRGRVVRRVLDLLSIGAALVFVALVIFRFVVIR